MALLAVGAGLLWLASRFTWTWSIDRTPLRGNVVAVRTGDQAVRALVPLALLALAAVAALLAVGGWLRRIVGVLVGCAGLAVLWLAIGDLGSVFGTHPNGYPLSQILAGRGIAVLGGVALGIAGLLTVRGAGRMPRLGARYAAPAEAKRAANADAELWHALSEGRDPTDES